MRKQRYSRFISDKPVYTLPVCRKTNADATFTPAYPTDLGMVILRGGNQRAIINPYRVTQQVKIAIHMRIAVSPPTAEIHCIKRGWANAANTGGKSMPHEVYSVKRRKGQIPHTVPFPVTHAAPMLLLHIRFPLNPLPGFLLAELAESIFSPEALHISI